MVRSDIEVNVTSYNRFTIVKSKEGAKLKLTRKCDFLNLVNFENM